MPRIFTMGNACPTKKPTGSGHGKMAVPRNLKELLEDLTAIDINNLDGTIEGHPVMREFRNHLRHRRLDEDENALRFLVLVQALLNCDQQLKQAKLSESRKTSLRRQQEEVFRKAVATFFAQDGDGQIALSNQTLSDKLFETADAEAVTDTHLEYLRLAKEDSSVWAELVEPTYLKFLEAYKQKVNLAACLLSIL